LQIITMGKTPFGDIRRSWMVVIVGIFTAILGMLACFIPGLIAAQVRMLAGIILFVGGFALLLQLIFSKERAIMWIKIPGILQQLAFACGLVYLMSLILGFITLRPGITTDQRTAVLLVIYGISYFYLSWCIQRVNILYPPKVRQNPSKKSMTSDSPSLRNSFMLFKDASLPLQNAIIVLVGVLLTLLGLLLFPVNLGMIPFSPDGQLGLLLVITSIQILALGETPMGQYRRSWLLVTFGIAFASIGIVSCIVPGVLTGVIQILLGFLNIIGGSVVMIRRFFPMQHGIKKPPADPVPFSPIIKKLLIIQIVINILTIAFGISMLVPGLVSGLAISGILVINGLLLLVLVYTLHKWSYALG